MPAFPDLPAAQEHGAFVAIDEDRRPPRGRSPPEPAPRPAPRHPRRGQGPDRRRRAADRARAEQGPRGGARRRDRRAPAGGGRGDRRQDAHGRARPRRAHAGRERPARRGAAAPAGSSGGSAIAVATGAALLALATDTAGSARIPAAACGVAGLCAAAGWMPTDGVSILAPSFDRLGLIAATAEDLALAWTALGGTIGEPPTRVVTLADDQLGRVDPEHLEAAHDAAHHLSPQPLELATPSLPQFGPPRATAIGAEAVARHDPRDAESAAARAQLEAAAQSDADVARRPRPPRRARRRTAAKPSATASSSRPPSPQRRRAGTTSKPPTPSCARPAA